MAGGKNNRLSANCESAGRKNNRRGGKITGCAHCESAGRKNNRRVGKRTGGEGK